MNVASATIVLYITGTLCLDSMSLAAFLCFLFVCFFFELATLVSVLEKLFVGARREEARKREAARAKCSHYGRRQCSSLYFLLCLLLLALLSVAPSLLLSVAPP